MFVLPLIALPFLLAVAAYRLFAIPRRLLAGELHFARDVLSLRTSLTLLAYVVLLGYTVVIVVLLMQTLPRALSMPVLWLSVAPLVAGYPFVYIAAEWIFYYGFRRPPKL